MKKWVVAVLTVVCIISTVLVSPVSAATELTGKTALFVGDSITYGYRDSRPGYGWAGRLADQCGMICENAGSNGSALSTVRPDRTRIIDLLKKYDGRSFDYVILHGGVNDGIGPNGGKGDPVPVGRILEDGENASPDISTFAGALEELFQYTTTHFSNSRLGFIINYATPNSGYGGKSQKMNSYWSVARELCQKYKIWYLDLYSGHGSDGQSYSHEILAVETDRYLYGSGDHLHLTAAGYERITPYIVTFMKSILLYGTYDTVPVESDKPSPATTATPANQTTAALSETTEVQTVGGNHAQTVVTTKKRKSIRT